MTIRRTLAFLIFFQAALLVGFAAAQEAESGVAETREERRRFERLPGSEPVTKIERIKSAYDSALIGRSTFDCETPTAAPSAWPLQPCARSLQPPAPGNGAARAIRDSSRFRQNRDL